MMLHDSMNEIEQRRTKWSNLMMTTGAVIQHDPHFFQPLLPGFRQKLTIPEAFMSMYLEDELNKRRKTESEPIPVVLFMKRNHMITRSKESEWVVHLMGRDIVEGWSKFIDDHDPYLKMEVGDIIVFKHKGNMVFEVSVFDSYSGCEKINTIKTTTTTTNDHHDSPPVNTRKKMTTRKKKKKEKIENSRPCKKRKTQELVVSPPIYPYFDSVIRKRQYVPFVFIRENGLERNCKMILKDVDGGRKWVVWGKISAKKSQFAITKGWMKFLNGNGLGVVGDCFRFYLIKKAKTPILHFTKLEKNHDDDDGSGSLAGLKNKKKNKKN